MMKTLSSTLFGIIAVAFLHSLVHADGWIDISESYYRHHPRPTIVAPTPPPPALEVTQHHVDIQIDRGIAEVSIDETFRNPFNVGLEGTYYFPLPADAHVEDFRLQLGDQELAGEVLERDKAQQIYQDLLRRQIDPALLEYYQRGLFRARVFPIHPHGEVRLKLRYRQSLRPQSGIVRLSYPLDTGRFAAGPYRDVRIGVHLTSDQTIASATCPTHPIQFKWLSPREVRGVFATPELFAHKDFVFEYLETSDGLAAGFRAGRHASDDGFFWVRFAPGQSPPTTRAPVNVVLVVDTSGSMAGQKIEYARKALNEWLARLDAADQFRIIAFDSRTQTFAPSFLRATPENLAAARDFVARLVARGGTDIHSALVTGITEAAAGDAGATVLLITDGAPTVGETNAAQIVRLVSEKNRGDFRIHVFGVGEGVNTVLLDDLARRNGGSRTYLTDGQRLEVAVSSLLDKVLFPCFGNLQLEVEGSIVSISQLEPAPPYDLFFGEDLVITGRYRGHGATNLRATGFQGGVRTTLLYPVAFPAHGGDETPAFVWAEHRIERLIDELRSSEPARQGALRSEIIALGLRYGIVTPFTSYLIREHGAGAQALSLRRELENLPSAQRVLDEEARGFAGSEGKDAFDYSQKKAGKLGRLRAGDSDVLLGYGGGAAAPRDAADAELAPLVRQLRKAGGRSFYPSDGRYVDSLMSADALPAPNLVLRFGSAEYFQFLADNPTAGSILAVARNLLFQWNAQVIEVKEAPSEAETVPPEPSRRRESF